MKLHTKNNPPINSCGKSAIKITILNGEPAKLIFDVETTLYKCYTNVLCLLGILLFETPSCSIILSLMLPESHIYGLNKRVTEINKIV